MNFKSQFCIPKFTFSLFAYSILLVHQFIHGCKQTKCELRNAKLRFEAQFNSTSSNLTSHVKDILNCFDTDRAFYLREVTDPCWLEKDLPRYSHDISKYIIVYFNEFISHYSDDEWDTSKYFKSYLVWSREPDCSYISMYPTNKEYSDYTFYIDTNMCSLEFAAFIIFRYFNSGIRNKRQNITDNSFLKQLGIFLDGKY